MTREEAIRILDPETTKEELVGINVYATMMKVVDEACILAVSALREQEEREKGCEYCTDSEYIFYIPSEIHDSMDDYAYISGDKLNVDIERSPYVSADIKFCPMCGRRLSKLQKEDT